MSAVENGITTAAFDSLDVCPIPTPIIAVPADAGVPVAHPSTVEPISGQLVERKKGSGRVAAPIDKSLRMELMLQFVSGGIPTDAHKRLAFIKLCDLTPKEKAYLVKHEFFKDLYDARLFDMFMGLEPLTKEDLKLIQIIGLRVGLSKPMAMMNVQNMQINNAAKRERKVNIKVRK